MSAASSAESVHAHDWSYYLHFLKKSAGSLNSVLDMQVPLKEHEGALGKEFVLHHGAFGKGRGYL